MNPKKFLVGSLMFGGLLTFMSLLFSKVGSGKPKLKQPSLEVIDNYIESQMRRLKIPGGVLTIVEGEKIIHSGCFGKARPNGEVPSTQTPFFIGSLTKSITALAIMQLVEAGKVELDAPVQRYLPWFRVSDPQASAQIKIRHLLNQTSGLPEGAGESVIADSDNRPDANERQIRKLSKLKIDYPVGSKVAYCNLNYNILGLVIEAASGQPYTDYLQTHIFNPLNMSRSCDSKERAQKNGLAMGFRHWFGFPFPASNLPIPHGSLPAGQLISTSEDMANYLIAHLNGGRFLDKQILSKTGIDELHRGELEYVKMGISAGKYGMGWFEIDMGKIKTFSHGGNVPDFSSFMVIIPSQKIGLVLLFNSDPYGLPPIIGEVGMGVTALLAGQKPAPIRLDFIQWAFRLLPLIPILQIDGVVSTFRRLNKWHQHREILPKYKHLWTQHILPPLIPNLALTGMLVTILANKMFGFIKLFMPDVSLITLLSGSFAGVWSVLRTGLLLRAWRKP